MLLHITTWAAWQTAVSAQTPYTTPSLADEGFIHCSTINQLLVPANERFIGQQDLVLLCIDANHVAPPIVYEDCYDTGVAFPHIYGPLNLDAVLGAIAFPPHADGSFALPSLLTRYIGLPILEFDNAPEAIIEPTKVVAPIDIPPACVLCFFQDVIADLQVAGALRQLYRLGSEIGPNFVYEYALEGERIALIHAGVGGPLAGAFMEELIALGCRHFIACGGCGVLAEKLALGQVVVPTTAVRDEGTSYHYLPPSREVAISATAVAALEMVLQRHHVPYLLGKTWTTDGIYRETQAKVAQRRAEGCLTVEMETAAFAAIAQFRNVSFGQLLYSGDSLVGDAWDSRDWHRQNHTREKLFQLAAEACVLLLKA